jgi:hypothetical protein
VVFLERKPRKGLSLRSTSIAKLPSRSKQHVSETTKVTAKLFR